MRGGGAWSTLAVLLLLLCGSVQCQPAPGDIPEAEVIHWETSPRGHRNDSITCIKPKEVPAVYSDCRPLSGNTFPANRASCQCTECNLQISLQCHSDGKWYLDTANVCDPETARVKCGVCIIEDIPENVRCEARSKKGFINEARNCTCKSNCQDVTLRCDATSTFWKPSSYAEQLKCQLKTFHYVENGVNVTYAGGKFSLSCAAGLTMRTPGSASCNQGVLSRTDPECVVPTPITAPLTRNPTPLTTTIQGGGSLTASSETTPAEASGGPPTDTPSSTEDASADAGASNSAPAGLDTTHHVLIGVSVILALTVLALGVTRWYERTGRVCFKPVRENEDMLELRQNFPAPIPDPAGIPAQQQPRGDPAYLDILPLHPQCEEIDPVEKARPEDPEYEDLDQVQVARPDDAGYEVMNPVEEAKYGNVKPVVEVPEYEEVGEIAVYDDVGPFLPRSVPRH